MGCQMSRTHNHGSFKRTKEDHPLYYLWMQKEPKFWRKLMKHKKRRSSQRQAIHKVMRGNEDTNFPLDKKPWVYYW